MRIRQMLPNEWKVISGQENLYSRLDTYNIPVKGRKDPESGFADDAKCGFKQLSLR